MEPAGDGLLAARWARAGVPAPESSSPARIGALLVSGESESRDLGLRPVGASPIAELVHMPCVARVGPE
jgi:hypothetical protein